MSKIFTRTFRVRWSELDASGQVSPANYLRYLVETAYDWGDAFGLGSSNEASLGLFWLIRETEIHLLRPLHHNDVFDFMIWMVNWQRVRGTRCFELKLKDSGEVIAQGTQQIVCMDRATQRPASPPEEIMNNFRWEEPRIFPYKRFPKVTRSDSTFTSQRQVEWQDLDALEHVNNAIYITYAEEAAAQALAASDWPPSRLAEQRMALAARRVQVQYHSPAVWGEMLTVSSHSLDLEADGGARYVGIFRTDGSIVAECILDWKLVDRETSETRPLPDGLAEELRK